jgi:DNA mismatch repair protein MutL
MNPNRSGWEKMYEGLETKSTNTGGNEEKVNPHWIQTRHEETESLPVTESNSNAASKLFQVQNRFIVANVKSGLLIVDQQKANERIIFERISSYADSQSSVRQRVLFPQTIQLSAVDAEIISEIMNDLDSLGFEISSMGSGSFVINTVPQMMPSDEILDFIDSLLEDYKKERSGSTDDKRIKLARIIAGNMAVKTAKTLKPEEMQQLIDELFACRVPDIAPDGSRVLKIIQVQEIDKLIGK